MDILIHGIHQTIKNGVTFANTRAGPALKTDIIQAIEFAWDTHLADNFEELFGLFADHFQQDSILIHHSHQLMGMLRTAEGLHLRSEARIDSILGQYDDGTLPDNLWRLLIPDYISEVRLHLKLQQRNFLPHNFGPIVGPLVDFLPRPDQIRFKIAAFKNDDPLVNPDFANFDVEDVDILTCCYSGQFQEPLKAKFDIWLRSHQQFRLLSNLDSSIVVYGRIFMRVATGAVHEPPRHVYEFKKLGHMKNILEICAPECSLKENLNTISGNHPSKSHLIVVGNYGMTRAQGHMELQSRRVVRLIAAQQKPKSAFVLLKEGDICTPATEDNGFWNWPIRIFYRSSNCSSFIQTKYKMLTLESSSVAYAYAIFTWKMSR